ncbi:MAG: hypothetical protein ACREC1_02450 [Methylovirgula sp.]
MDTRILRMVFAGAALFGAAAAVLAATSAVAAPQQIPATTARSLSDWQREVIKRRVLREAKVSIVPLGRGEPEQFADQLVVALKNAGAWVAVGTSDPGQTVEPGLVVYYDHTVPADASIFLALERAGLKPIDRDIPGAPVATIMVGPQPAR